MDPPPVPTTNGGRRDSDSATSTTAPAVVRRGSSSQQSDDSQTAADFIRDQMQLEADAREALPYSIEHCTKPLGPLRQPVFGCLTCNPPPANPTDSYSPAGVCYSCSVQCHGEHTLVEIFNKRNFTCDCGTTRFPATAPCTLRINPATNTKGDVHSETPDPNNKYNQNFRNRFCSCEGDYDPFQQKGTMFQCLGLGTVETGGCGEDWYHPGCVVGMGPKWYEKMERKNPTNGTGQDVTANDALPAISEDAEAPQTVTLPTDQDEQVEEDDDPPPPPGFPAEEDFEVFICYKCVDAYPWIKRYAGTKGFLSPVYSRPVEENNELPQQNGAETSTKKRKAEDDGAEPQELKRPKSETESVQEGQAVVESSEEKPEAQAEEKNICKLDSLPAAPTGQFSLFGKGDFREHFCRCPSCFPLLKPHPQLLEEEEIYEPPISDNGSENGASTHGSGSLLERGESALRNVDRVRAIEGVMAYNHLKEQLKPFFQQFAESGKAISAEDIKEYFAKLRGDDEAIKEAGEAAKEDFRKEQSGY
ncbi:Protein mlo2 [Pleurostoma richardsiae]|uniref:Protein mlo2 n=1 Tax=Pleurostoma richardsiae TaxID=41990 RepID=A0AA38VQM0_9PEZI|nr:Protein mlo2 [Pleurostoma richardsiae]